MRNKLVIKSILIILFVLVFMGCKTADGAAILVGEPRAPIMVEEVKVYSELPDNYELIAILNASSDWSSKSQENYNYAIAELKKQAAKIGANGIVIESMGESKRTSTSFVYTGFIPMVVPTTVTTNSVSAKAIYVIPEEQ